jgi:hypothetical protein
MECPERRRCTSRFSKRNRVARKSRLERPQMGFCPKQANPATETTSLRVQKQAKIKRSKADRLTKDPFMKHLPPSNSAIRRRVPGRVRFPARPRAGDAELPRDRRRGVMAGELPRQDPAAPPPRMPTYTLSWLRRNTFRKPDSAGGIADTRSALTVRVARDPLGAGKRYPTREDLSRPEVLPRLPKIAGL